MSWSLLATVFSALNGAYNFITSLFGKKKDATVGLEDANTRAVAIENKINQVAAQTSRESQANIDEGVSNAQTVADDRHAQLAAAGNSLRARGQVLDATRDRADSSAGSER
ncbi:hypothetical protein [Caballeronia sp. LZ034LL]|uniref:hypothetical protein n=1 Tax=Caballeronia sp. LZ034LL TaxID=3038567 RepID=UPI00285F28CC|nr:hypothetical protein [Caballeronia sp. LZ034LL]MDR5839324.1 hypothetical protein [Caballeronia sp. LZ034LL]